jgi:hypothetical protein
METDCGFIWQAVPEPGAWRGVYGPASQRAARHRSQHRRERRAPGSRAHGVPLEQLLKDIVGISPTSQSKILNTIKMLENLNLLAIDLGADIWAVSSITITEDFFAGIRHRTARSFASRITLTGRETCIRANAEGSGVELDSLLLPGVMDGFRLWLIEFDIAVRSAKGQCYCPCRDWFALV